MPTSTYLYLITYWSGAKELATGESAQKVAETLWAWDLDSVTICSAEENPDIVRVYSNEAWDFLASVEGDGK